MGGVRLVGGTSAAPRPCAPGQTLGARLDFRRRLRYEEDAQTHSQTRGGAWELPGNTRDEGTLAHGGAHERGPGAREALADLRYWRNGTYYIVTDQPWALPATKVMFTGGARDDTSHTPGKLEVLAIRMDAISKHIDERNQLGTTISPAGAVAFTEAAEDLPSPMVSHCLPAEASVLSAAPTGCLDAPIFDPPVMTHADRQLIAHDDHCK